MVTIILIIFQIDEIKREGQSNNVNIKYDNDLGEIKLHGLAKNMMPVKDRINQILRSHEKSKHEHQQAKLLANIVRWFYLKEQKQYPFPDDWNKKVEEAYQRKDKTVKVKDRSGGEYEIDFTSMEEKDLKHSKKFTILRRDIVAGKLISSYCPPPFQRKAEGLSFCLFIFPSFHLSVLLSPYRSRYLVGATPHTVLY